MKTSIFWQNGNSAINDISISQAISLMELKQQFNMNDRIYISSLPLSKCITIEVNGITIGIEEDGYRHS